MIKKKQIGFEEKIDRLAAATEKGFENMAIMVQRGFEETASKSDLEAVRLELKSGIGEVKIRLDRIENILLRDHNNRIERLEDKLMQVEVILGKKLLK